jgi:tRNA C32,U32 (ribose-2'-O)-methylase TrmJ
VTYVAATTARQRENLPIMDAKEAVQTLRAAAAEGKVAVVFGNEATVGAVHV